MAEPAGSGGQPTVPPPGPEDLSAALARNIETVARRRAEEDANASRGTRVALAIGKIIGRMTFVYAHIVAYGLWLIVNTGLVTDVKPFDPGLDHMGTIASVEALFLSLFILINQNRASANGDRRDDLNLQISLLAEHEITQMIKLNMAVAEHLGVDTAEHEEMHDLKQNIAPEAVLDKIEDAAGDTTE